MHRRVCVYKASEGMIVCVLWNCGPGYVSTSMNTM